MLPNLQPGRARGAPEHLMRRREPGCALLAAMDGSPRTDGRIQAAVPPVNYSPRVGEMELARGE
jgi:hypothetical protein